MAEAARNLLKGQKPATAGPELEPGRKSALREYSEAFAIALALALVIRTFFIQAYKIPSGSMEPTLLVGDHILVNKLIYGLRLPDSFFGLKIPGIPWGEYLFPIEPVHRGDVVVFVFPPDPSRDFIKRVIGVAGDTVAIKQGLLFLNGKQFPDPHAHFTLSASERSGVSPRDNFGPVTVPKGQLFMMGDNRDRSYDSRFWGFVDTNYVEGRAILIYWSWDSSENGLLPIRWNRFGKIIY